MSLKQPIFKAGQFILLERRDITDRSSRTVTFPFLIGEYDCVYPITNVFYRQICQGIIEAEESPISKEYIYSIKKISKNRAISILNAYRKKKIKALSRSNKSENQKKLAELSLINYGDVIDSLLDCIKKIAVL